MNYPHLQKLAQHIFITGHSGSGKSTLAQQLHEELGLPVYPMDYNPNIRAYVKQLRAADPNKLGFPSDDPEALVAIRKAMQDVEGLSYPHIVEGTQIAWAPEHWPGNRLIYVDTPLLQIIRQRLKRDRLKGKHLPVGSRTAKERAAITRRLFEALSVPLEDVAKYPETERMRPRREFAELLAKLNQESTTKK
jgi:cytidylate kinase